MNDREQRGLALAALYRIEQRGGVWIVPSQRGDGATYTVDPEKRHCDCRDHQDRAIKCKHMFAVEFVQTREKGDDGAETVTRTFKVTERVTYRQDWPSYNKAQTNEKRHFQSILADLCRGIVAPIRQGKGRPAIPPADVTFACVSKVYSTFSARRFACDLADAAEKGFIDKCPHFNAVVRHMDDPALTPILKALIIESSKPLASVESDFAIDSSGFSTSRFRRWFDIKYGKTMEEREWVKIHIACGVKTNVVTAVEILGMTAGDSPQLAPLIKRTAETFTMREVSADKAYSGAANLEAIESVGAVPYVAFKDNATGAVGGVFAKAFHYFKYKRDEFLAHYHKRSNVESTFSMMKAKFGDAIRSRTDVSMRNEALCKILCHNVCCLIQSIYELGITATFWRKDETVEPEPSVVAADEMADLWAWV